MSPIELGGATSAEQIRAPAAETQVAQRQSVFLGGQAIQKMPSLAQLVQDLQEEISFAYQQKVDSEEKFDEGIEDQDRAAHLRERMIERIKQVYDSLTSVSKSCNRQELLLKIRSVQIRNPDGLLEELGKRSSDYGEMLSILVSIADEFPAKSASASLLDKAIIAASAKWENQIAAGANTLAEAKKHSERIGIERDQLQLAYQDSVLTYKSIVGALGELAGKFGFDKVDAGTAFLQEAARADLVDMPSFVEPEHLEHTLLELQGMKIFRTLRERVDNAHECACASDEVLSKIDRKWQASNYIRALNDSSEFDASIKTGVASGSPELKHQVLLLQDLRMTITETPEHYFQQGGKDRAITPWQNEIDQLIYQESEV